MSRMIQWGRDLCIVISGASGGGIIAGLFGCIFFYPCVPLLGAGSVLIHHTIVGAFAGLFLWLACRLPDRDRRLMFASAVAGSLLQIAFFLGAWLIFGGLLMTDQMVGCWATMLPVLICACPGFVAVPLSIIGLYRTPAPDDHLIEPTDC